MNICKKRKPFISLVCAISLILSMLSIPVYAADTNRVTATTDAAVKQGSYAYCYVYIDSVKDIAALDVSVHFDPAKVKITSVYNSVSCTLYDSVTKTDQIQFSYILDGKGAESKTRLFYFRYQVLSGAETGTTRFDITIGEAYDNSLNDLPISGSSCSFVVNETVTSKSCSVYGSSTVSTAIGKEFTLNYSFSTYQIASGTTVITYDPELFEVVEVTTKAFLTGKVVDVNTNLPGEIYISFVGIKYDTSTSFVSVKFRTIKNITQSAKIQFKAVELLDLELNPYTCSGYTTTANIAYDQTYLGDAPAMELRGSFSYEAKQITLEVNLEAGSRLGAGDFVIKFDPRLVSYQSCKKGFAPTFFNINDKNTEAGELKFHIISLSDIVTEETVLTVVFDVNQPANCAAVDFDLSGTSLTDSLTESIPLNFLDASVLLEYRVTFCDEAGKILQSGMYHYGDPVIAPAAPEKPEDVNCTYTFSGWGQEVTTCTGDATYTASYTMTRKPAVQVGEKAYATLAEAMEQSSAGSTLQLLRTVEETATVSGNFCLDLNGFDLVGAITVTGSLFVKDSQTDDYTVEDAFGYGELEVVSGNVIAAEGYLLITEDGAVSAHRIDMEITDMVLRPSAAGVYYKSEFSGDEIVAQNVKSYGVALSVKGQPTAENPGVCSWYDRFESGSSASGTLLKGIMKKSNSQTVNAENAEMDIYGRTYILTQDGQYILGATVSRSLRQQVEAVDGMWNTLDAEQKAAVLSMYEAFPEVMDNWKIPNLLSASE